MAVVKHHLADAYLRALPPGIRALLVYGPDSGLVNERLRLALTSFGADPGDPFSSIRIDEEELRKDPGRLADETLAMAMFAGRRSVWARAGGVDLTGALAGIAGRIPDDVLLLLEAGDLRPTSPVRKFFESTEGFAAIPCYADSADDIAGLIDNVLGAAGLSIDRDARTALALQLGGDRQASRLELEKLVLYAHGKSAVDIDDVAAICGDAAASRLDDLVDAVALGDVAAADRATQRHLRAGAAPAELVAAAMRHFLQLHDLRQQIDAGAPARGAVSRIRPPVFFKRVEPVTRQCTMWSTARLERALDVLHEAERHSRMLPVPGLAWDAAGRALLHVAMLARSAGQPQQTVS